MAERQLPFREGLHAASHALINVVPLFLLCNSSDLGAECDNPYDTRFRPERLLIFDKHPGGIGLARQVCGSASPCTRSPATNSAYCAQSSSSTGVVAFGPLSQGLHHLHLFICRCWAVLLTQVDLTTCVPIPLCALFRRNRAAQASQNLLMGLYLCPYCWSEVQASR